MKTPPRARVSSQSPAGEEGALKLPSADWLRNKVATDPNVDTEAFSPIPPAGDDAAFEAWLATGVAHPREDSPDFIYWREAFLAGRRSIAPPPVAGGNDR